jgi:AraC-like DNA-binding protein
MADRLDRILGGVQVDIDPAAISDVAAARGVLALACGATIRISDCDVTILQPGRRLRVVANGAPLIRVTYGGVVNLFDHIDRPLVASFAADDPLSRCTAQLMDELAVERPGRRAMAATLLRELLILVLRRCRERGHLPEAWLAALDDPRLARPLEAMRDRPEHTFTVAELAELAGMSRTVFAARFMEAFAQPPFEFLTRLRLERAAQLLTSTELPVKGVAAQVGYASRSSFTRAFLATYGVAPKTFRDVTLRPSAGDIAHHRIRHHPAQLCELVGLPNETMNSAPLRRA